MMSASSSPFARSYPTSCSMAATFWLSASFIWQPMVQIKKRLPLGGSRLGATPTGVGDSGTSGMICLVVTGYS